MLEVCCDKIKNKQPDPDKDQKNAGVEFLCSQRLGFFPRTVNFMVMFRVMKGLLPQVSLLCQHYGGGRHVLKK